MATIDGLEIAPARKMTPAEALSIGTLRAHYGLERLGLPMVSTHRDRAEWLGLEGEALSAAADRAVLAWGMSQYCAERMDNDQGLDTDDFEALRDYYVRGEILHRRHGQDLRKLRPAPDHFAAWAKTYRANVDRRKAAASPAQTARTIPAAAADLVAPDPITEEKAN